LTPQKSVSKGIWGGRRKISPIFIELRAAPPPSTNWEVSSNRVIYLWTRIFYYLLNLNLLLHHISYKTTLSLKFSPVLCESWEPPGAWDLTPQKSVSKGIWGGRRKISPIFIELRAAPPPSTNWEVSSNRVIYLWTRFCHILYTLII
jgi:hypothetical protein